jgi:hypothetical protein
VTAKKEEEKVDPASKIKPPASARTRDVAKSTNSMKPEAHGQEDLTGVDDPVAQCTQDRVNNGGIQSSLTDAEAKAKKVKVVKAPKTGKVNEALLDVTPKEP